MLDYDRASWGDPLADWTFHLLPRRAAPNVRALFWQEYGIPEQTARARFRALVYEGMLAMCLPRPGDAGTTSFSPQRVASCTRFWQSYTRWQLSQNIDRRAVARAPTYHAALRDDQTFAMAEYQVFIDGEMLHGLLNGAASGAGERVLSKLLEQVLNRVLGTSDCTDRGEALRAH